MDDLILLCDIRIPRANFDLLLDQISVDDETLRRIFGSVSGLLIWIDASYRMDQSGVHVFSINPQRTNAELIDELLFAADVGSHVLARLDGTLVLRMTVAPGHINLFIEGQIGDIFRAYMTPERVNEFTEGAQL